jgi:predicted phage terminase large subunit-like protein
MGLSMPRHRNLDTDVVIDRNPDPIESAPGTRDGAPLQFNWASNDQREIFCRPKTRYTVAATGRRWGKTRGAMLGMIRRMLSQSELKALWVDTTQGNLDRYVERYALPQLNKLLPNLWSWVSQKKLLKFANGSYCDFRSAERPENIEGFGYGLGILNEAGIILNDRNLWQTSIRPMLMDYKADVFIIGTPKGKHDKTGGDHLFWEMWRWGDSERDTHPDWTSINRTSYDNPLLPADEIRAMEADIPEVLRQQEVYGRFIDIAAESLCQERWFNYVESAPVRGWAGTMRRVLSIDTAFKKGDQNDYSAGVALTQTWDGQWYVEDAWEERLDFPELIARVQKAYDKEGYDLIIIEDKASGQSLIQAFQRSPVPVVPYKSDKDKIARLVSVTPLIESGKVHIVKGAWNKALVGRCVMFPYVEYDDIVDAFSQGLDYCRAPIDFDDKRRVYSRKFVPMSDSIQGY